MRKSSSPRGGAAEPEQWRRIGSPFAAQFLYEALDILGEPGAILASIRENYLPMIEAGATTVWETFPGSTYSPSASAPRHREAGLTSSTPNPAA